MSDRKYIKVEGAREHNLKNIDVTIPHHALTMVTGLSGSGKSSLALDTIFEECQREYLATFSSKARGFMGKLGRPAFDNFFGAAPAVGIHQTAVIRSPRATVGTATGLYSHLRLLMARFGSASCTKCGETLQAWDAETIAAFLQPDIETHPATLTAPLVEDHFGSRTALLKTLAGLGAEAAIIDGHRYHTRQLPELTPGKRHTIEAVISDHLTRKNLRDTLKKGFQLGNGAVMLHRNNQTQRFDLAGGCTACGQPAPARGPRLFSFNHEKGACPNCKGLGLEDRLDEDLLIADPTKTLRQGALVPTTPKSYIVYSQVTMDVLNQIAQQHGFSVDQPWNTLSTEQKNVIFYGSKAIKVPFGKHPLESRLKWKGIVAKPREEGYYKGILTVMAETLKRDRNPNILRFVVSSQCSACSGSRLRPESLAVRLDGRNIYQWSQLSIDQLSQTLDHLSFPADQQPAAAVIIEDILPNLQRLSHLGLGYLTLDRAAATLSGGEARRIKLAGQVRAHLSGLLYVLDEPAMGLHPGEREHLYRLITELKEKGNTIIAVEHDPALAARADHLLDIGPKAGSEGGELLYQGPPSGLMEQTRSHTAKHLNGYLAPRRPRKDGPFFTLRGAAVNNLKTVDAPFKIGCLNLVVGVSGSGKSSLVNQTLAAYFRARFEGKPHKLALEKIEAGEQFRKLIHVDQKPIGRTPRSNPATYTGLMDQIRNLFASLEQAKNANLKKTAFSMNTKGGGCPTCGGSGFETVGMHGMADIDILCGECEGQRFRSEVLQIRYRDRNIAETLALSVDQALSHFDGQKKIIPYLEALQSVGLGYIQLGQPATTLSGGEAQRIKLASELVKSKSGQTLIILDEPTTGLHPDDIVPLITALDALCERGHTVVVVEHNPRFIRHGDWVLELGPGAGPKGGEIIHQGTPEELAQKTNSLTGKALAALGEPLPAVATVAANPPREIHLQGVRTHNLADIDVRFPRGAVTVVCGVSGSGKSSLAFSTLAELGRTRFAENLSPWIRRFLRSGKQPNLDQADGLTPTVALAQQQAAGNKRTTPATMTDIADLIRLLFSRAGQTPEGKSLPLSHFSFNHRQGACPACEGLGRIEACDPSRLISHPNLPLAGGAMNGNKPGKELGDPFSREIAILQAVGELKGFDYGKPWSELPEDAQQIALYGLGNTTLSVNWHFKRGNRQGTHSLQTTWPGLCPIIEDAYQQKKEQKRGQAYRPLMRGLTCPTCDGKQLNPESLSVTFAGFDIAAFQERTIGQLRDHIDNGLGHHPSLSDKNKAVAEPILERIRQRLATLGQLGLDYLQLNRAGNTLSAGERRRLQLCAHLASGLSGVTFILDEPTSGLHPENTQQLLAVINQIKEQGNTIVIIEHDSDIIRAADHIIELGPGAGDHGGRLSFSGTVDQLLKADTPTAQFLRQEQEPVDIKEEMGPGRLQILGAAANNLKNIDVGFETQRLTAVTGPSGSGKTSLIFQTLAASAQAGRPVNCRTVEGLDVFSEVVALDRRPLGRTPASVPATVLNLLDDLRICFAASPEAQELGLTKKDFSFNSKGGRCETCSGMGLITTQLDFLPDSQRPCESCDGNRYGEPVRRCRIGGFNLGELLQKSISEAAALLPSLVNLKEAARECERLGLGYLPLGRGVDGLSGGESQRLALAAKLRHLKPNSLILLDEPTSGLHGQDTFKLLQRLRDLTDQGHTIIAVEHQPSFVRGCDRRVQLGPGSGNEGGHLIS